MKFVLSLLLIISANYVYSYNLKYEQFDEQLKIKSLPDARVESAFSFKTILKGASPRNPHILGDQDVSQHYVLFPLSFGQVLREYAVTELHLTLNAGSWNYDRWGYPEEKSVGSGAELWAWMASGSRANIDERWQGLRNALAGLFCASLSAMDEQRTTSPTHSYNPEGLLPSWNGSEIHELRHASLPSEHVCTENLTPFLKLLPCKSLSGIATLLNPHRLFDADWHGMGIHVRWLGEPGIEIRLTFQSVMNPLRPTIQSKPDWSFQSLFDRTINSNCPAANSSTIHVALPDDDTYTLTLEPSNDTIAGIIDILSAQKPLNVAMHTAIDFQYPSAYENSIPFSVVRTLKGTTQSHGTLSVVLKNHQHSTQHFLYLETIPWFVQVFLHTVQVHVDGQVRGDIISDISYTPPVPRSRPTTLQFMLSLPPRSVTRFTMNVDKAFLRYTEHPPDAQRGWDLPPAVLTPITFYNNSNSVQLERTLGNPIYTSTLLVDVATPDFSMPYNVIIFTCSLIAFIFGSTFNMLTRRFVVLHLDPISQK